MALISSTSTLQPICAIVFAFAKSRNICVLFAYAENRVFRNAAHIIKELHNRYA